MNPVLKYVSLFPTQNPNIHMNICLKNLHFIVFFQYSIEKYIVYFEKNGILNM